MTSKASGPISILNQSTSYRSVDGGDSIFAPLQKIAAHVQQNKRLRSIVSTRRRGCCSNDLLGVQSAIRVRATANSIMIRTRSILSQSISYRSVDGGDSIYASHPHRPIGSLRVVTRTQHSHKKKHNHDHADRTCHQTDYDHDHNVNCTQPQPSRPRPRQTLNYTTRN